jgi:hypothetical protein
MCCDFCAQEVSGLRRRVSRCCVVANDRWLPLLLVDVISSSLLAKLPTIMVAPTTAQPTSYEAYVNLAKLAI